MAISPLLEQKDSKIIVKTLLETRKTVKELNEYFLTTKIIAISTATLYRRVKELYLAGFLEKLEDGSYTVSDIGKTAYNELFSQKYNLDEIQNNISLLVRQINQKESYILKNLQKHPSYTSGLVQDLSISPNDLLQFLENLIRLKLIEVVEKPGKKPGRPKKVYRLTDTGKHILQELEDLRYKLYRKS